MPNQAPLSPARVLYEQLLENEDAGSLDTCPAPQEADDQAAAAVSHGDMDRIRIDRTRDSVYTPKVEQFQSVDRISSSDPLQSRSALAAIIRLQSTEIERLALENDRLAVELSAVHQFHENEQNQRRNLERQLRETGAGNEPPAPAFDIEEIRRAAREGMSAEIKPVLVAILDLLETTLPRGAESENPAVEKPLAEKPAVEKPAAVGVGVPVSTPASLAAEVMNDFHRLPEILTRPLEELLSGPGKAGPAPRPVADLPAESRPRPPRHEARQPSVMPSAFAWTNLIS